MDNKYSILQWNCQGLQSKYESLKYIIKEKSPICIALQETMLGQKHLCPRQYLSYYTDYDADRGHHGGCALFLRSDVAHLQIPLQTELQVIAVQMHTQRKYTICSLYLPPANNLDQDLKQKLVNLLDQLPRPFILLGDFNGRHPMWGDVISNARGNLIDSFIEEEELAILNTGKPTHFHVQTGTFSAIDISLCSPNCYLDFSWEVMDDLMGSDHFPILIDLVNDEISAPRSPRWILDKANWALFQTLTFLDVSAEDFPTVDEALDFLNEVIIEAGLKAIPRSSGKFRRKPVPWWDIQCSITRKAMRAAFTQYRRNVCDLYLISYKKARARFRYQIKQAKRQSWIKYLSSINWRTTLPEVWSKIRKIAGKYIPTPLPVLKVNGLTLANPDDVSEAFADHINIHSLV